MSRSNRTFYAVYAVLMIVLAAVGIEIASGVVLAAKEQNADAFANSRHLYDPFRTHRLNPEYVRDFDTGGRRLHSTDGFRATAPVPVEKPADTYRIIMLGGSTLYGIGAEAPYPRAPTLPDERTIPRRIEARLNAALSALPAAGDAGNADSAASPRVEVINAGVVAYTTVQHLVYVNAKLHAYDADLMVFLDGHNDFYYYRPYDQWGGLAVGTTRLTPHVDARTGWFAALVTVRALAARSRFFLLVERWMEGSWRVPDTEVNGERPPVPPGNPADGGPGTDTADPADPATVGEPDAASVRLALEETVIANYRQIRTRVERDGTGLLVFLQPEIGFEDAASLSPADRALQELTAELDPNRHRAFNRALFPALFAAEDLAFVDVAELASPATRDASLYVDYCHLTPAGADALAERMVPAILERVEADLGYSR